MSSKQEMSRRRLILSSGAGLASGAFLLRNSSFAQHQHGEQKSAADAQPAAESARSKPGLAGEDYTPVITPNGTALPWKLVDGVKVFHLIAQEVRHEFAPGQKIRLKPRAPVAHLFDASSGQRI